MPEKKKTFDCIAMKNSIQSELLKEYEGLSLAREISERQRKLMTSDSLAAQIWRKAQEQRNMVMAVHEEPGIYTVSKKKDSTE